MVQRTRKVLAECTDRELLRGFAGGWREAAFGEVVRRHGAMVLGVCRSVLGNAADAEDAAQAVFLTLARRAKSLKSRVTLAGWLHRVAWFVALRSAAAATIRRQHEQRAAGMKKEIIKQAEEPVAAELLHEELASLPEKYRVALLLRHAEGCGETETAALLGCTVSAASVRLARGRKILRERLEKRGVTVSEAGLVIVLAEDAKAGVPPTFANSVTLAGVGVLAGKAASAVASAKVAALSKGALKMLFLAKLKLVGMAAAASVVVVGAVTVEAVAAGNESKPPVMVAQVTGGGASTVAPAAGNNGQQGNSTTTAPKVKVKKVRATTGNSGSAANGSSGDGQNGDGQNGDGQNGDGQNGDGQHGDGQNGDGQNNNGAHGDGQNNNGSNGDGQNGNTGGTGGTGATPARVKAPSTSPAK